MTHIGHREGSVGGHEVVILEVGGDVEVGAGAAGVADHRGAGSGAEGYAAHLFRGHVAVTNRPHMQQFAHPAQILKGIDRFGEFADDAESHPFGLARGLQQFETGDPEQFGQAPAHAARSAVEVRVTGIEDRTAADGPLDAALHHVGRIEPLQRMEDDRMVGDDQIAPFGLGLVEDLIGYVDRQQRLVHFVVAAADDEAGIVVGLLPAKRCKAFDYVGYFLDFHICIHL